MLTAQTEIMMLVRYLLVIPLGSNREWSFQLQHNFEFSRLYSEMQPTELTILITHYLRDTTKCITRTVWALLLIQCLFHVFLRDNIVAEPEWRDLVITFLVYFENDCWITGWSNLFFVLFVLNFTWRTLYSPYVSLIREV